MSKPTIPQTSLAGTLAVDPPNYTQVPNTLIDDLMPKMKEAELKVTMAIARETFGWHRDEKLLSLTRLQTLTGLSRQGVVNGIEDGLRRRVIERRAAGDSFTYRLLVNEVDQPSQRTRPAPVNQVDRRPVNQVDTAKKEEKKQGKKAHTARARSKFDLPTCKRFARTLRGIKNPDAYARAIYDGKLVGRDDEEIAEWIASGAERLTAPGVAGEIARAAAAEGRPLEEVAEEFEQVTRQIASWQEPKAAGGAEIEADTSRNLRGAAAEAT